MIIYFDTETTGLHPGQICQLSYVMQDKESVTAKNFFFTVDSVEYGAFMVHGFSVEKLRELSCGKRFLDYFDEIEKDFLSVDLIVSHNTAFDFSFMRTEYARIGKDFIIKNSFCTMKKATPICKLPRNSGVGYKYPKLNELCSFLGIKDNDISNELYKLFGAKAGYHDARFDTTAVYLVANRAMEKYAEFTAIKECL